MLSLAMTDSAQPAQRQSASSSWLQDLFRSSSDSKLEEREAQLKTLMSITVEQEPAWLAYLEARRTYRRAVRLQQTQELREIASGAWAYGTTLTTESTDNPVQLQKLKLKQKYEDLYASLDNLQRALADRELTPSECGK